MSMETPDSLAEKIRAAHEANRLESRIQLARDEERADRDVKVAQEFATTARLARLLSV
jgi:hypothetical protein